MILVVSLVGCSMYADACVKYAGDADVRGYCIAEVAQDLPREQAGARCSAAGPWEGDCRKRWVTARLREIGGPPAPSGLGLLTDDPARVSQADALLDFCEEDDCRFLVIDRFRDVDLVNQFRRCADAGRYASDCESHAVDAWADHAATRAELDALWASIPSLPTRSRARAATAAGRGYACLDLECPPGEEREACETAGRERLARGCAAGDPGIIGVPQGR